MSCFSFIFSPEFRHFAHILLAFIVIVCFLFLLIRLVFVPFKPKSSASAFEAFGSKSNHAGGSANCKPLIFDEGLKYDQRAPELTISKKLRKIDWFQFEKLIELIYQHHGFKVERLGGANADGGIDLIVKSPAEKFAVQCKHWRKWTVSVKEIREFLGALTDSKISKGVFITLVGYSDEARQLADKHGIQILDESDLIKMLENTGLIYSSEIFRLFSDERKFCPKCEKQMLLKINRLMGNRFWGCSNYPRCRFTLKLEE